MGATGLQHRELRALARRLSPPTLVLGAALSACAADPYDVELVMDGGRADAGDARTPTTPPSTTPRTGPAIVIEPPTMPTSCGVGEYFMGRVRGRLLDFEGRAVAGGNVTVCGSVCIPGVSGADGRFEVNINRCFTGTTEYAHGAALSFDGLGRQTDIYFDFNAGNEPRMGVVRIEQPLYVGSYTGQGYAPAPMAATAPMNLVDGLGFSLRIQPNTIEYPVTAPEEAVRVMRVPLTKLPPYGGRMPAVMYSIHPAEAVLSAPAAVTFPNVSGLRAGALVDIVAVGNHASLGRPAVGVLDRVGVGRVSSDGRTISADGGIRAFGVVGYRVMTP
jgi:hypothetical protein